MIGPQRGIRRAVAIGAALCALLTPLSAAAQGIYTSDYTGDDISFPQCGGAYPTTNAYRFGIVGVTSGHAFRDNPCFAGEYAWASGLGAPESVYLNLNEDIGTTAPYGDTGPFGVCGPDEACHALNYGYNAASSAYTHATAQVRTFTATTWWLDIETENSWSETDLARNMNVIAGAMQFLQGLHGFTVGIYSTAAQWGEITGGWQNGLPVWIGGGTRGDARSRCGAGFTGGPVYLVQFEDADFDGDYAC